MALYLYRGFHQDTFDDGYRWDDASDIFRVALIKSHASLNDASTGLNNADMMSVSEFFARASVNEVTVGEVSNYTRQSIQVAWRSIVWDPTNDLTRLKSSTAITWTNLASGATVGAYCIIRGVSGDDSQNRIWMADSSGTNLPAPTNGQNFSVTLNTNGWLTARQPLFGV